MNLTLSNIESKKVTLNLNSGAIHIKNNVNLKQRLSWLLFAYEAIPSLQKLDKKEIQDKIITFRIPLSKVKKFIGYTSSNNKILKEELKKLVYTETEWNIFRKDYHEWGTAGLLVFFKITTIKNQSFCEYAFSPFIQERLAYPEMYAKINLLISKGFNSKSALDIYCLALDYLDIKKNYSEKVLTLEEMRLYLGLEENEYKNSGDLYKRLLKPAEDDINNKSDMSIEIEVRKESEGKKTSKIQAFKLKMSIKKDFRDYYKPKFLEETTSDGQISIFDQIPQQSQETKEAFKKELVAVNNTTLKKFFSKHNISMTTDSIQEKLKEITSLFGEENREDYLLFLMKYTEKEVTKGSIKNIAGFFAKLLTDDAQTENYLINLEEQQQKIEKRKIQIESRINAKLQEKYQLEKKKLFQNYVIENIETLEEVFTQLVKTHITSGFAYDIVIKGQNKGIIDKTLITNQKPHIRLFVLQALEPYQKELGYKDISFEDWKAHTVNDEYLKTLRTEIEKELS